MSGEQRRLAAIVSADVAGYSRLMGRDESGTLVALKALRREIVDPRIKAHRGRIVKTTGDGLLLEFASVVDAVRCVVGIQTAMAAHNADVPQDRRIEFRVGVNIGDIIIDGDDIFGDGVNVAARLQELAEPGGICVSGRVQEDVRGKIDIPLEDAGEHQLKNIAWPVRVYRLRPESRPAPAVQIPLTLPDKPSIAVLPFANMSGDPEQEYFADGMAEDILTGLSRHRWLFVIARNSSFTYKGRAVDVRQVGRELGVRYVLEGSVRRAASQVRFTAQLIDTTSGSHLWADKYDGAVEDLFELQDRITEAVLGVLEPAIQRAEIERMRRKRPENLGAYDHYLRSLALRDNFTRESIQAALEGCLRAIDLDPSFAPPYGIAALTYAQKLNQGWIVDRAKDYGEALDLVERGLRADRLDPMMLAHAGISFAWFEHDLAKASAYIDEAIGINPNYATAYSYSAFVRIRTGDTRIAIDHLDRARLLSPRDPWTYSFFQLYAQAYIVDRKFETAFDWARRAVQLNPNYLSGWTALAASAAMSDRDAEARKAAGHILAIDPAFTISARRRNLPAGDEEMAPIWEGMRRAGLPE